MSPTTLTGTPAGRGNAVPAFRCFAQILIVGVVLTLAWPAIAANSTLIGWSAVGMQETDGLDCSVYALMPPFSTIQAQFISGGRLLTNAAAVSVTYQAVADATGSINRTSQGKGNFY